MSMFLYPFVRPSLYVPHDLCVLVLVWLFSIRVCVCVCYMIICESMRVRACASRLAFLILPPINTILPILYAIYTMAKVQGGDTVSPCLRWFTVGRVKQETRDVFLPAAIARIARSLTYPSPPPLAPLLIWFDFHVAYYCVIMFLCTSYTNAGESHALELHVLSKWRYFTGYSIHSVCDCWL